MAHTQAPWEYDNPDENGIAVVGVGLDNLPDGFSIAEVCSGESDQTLADARRIVACVNACEGIPTESLERGTLARVSTILDVVLKTFGSLNRRGTVYVNKANAILVDRVLRQTRETREDLYAVVSRSNGNQSHAHTEKDTLEKQMRWLEHRLDELPSSVSKQIFGTSDWIRIEEAFKKVMEESK